ncbi:Electron transfer DM13 [Botrimarina colliarenosi]|uniref:Electron transfer DM13 n=1 Tax=Botrimarina colliarenosi TaxID=2528001 RepID=A0A5C6AFB1_9BACT|nr:DM13 domain-containing protein [Botrimarina colliarenosi]TWT98107.1 Electron transfer DM13 [Botrimarina colliarenosi]
MRRLLPLFAPFVRGVLVLVLYAIAPAVAQPRVGWQADLATHYHGVSGLVTVVDAHTLRVDNLYFDGAGIDVYFYLGAENTTAAFTAGLEIGPQLLGIAFDGGSLTLDLPSGETIEGWNAISVWCTEVPVSFGDAVFAAPPAPPGDYNGDGAIDAADYTVWRDTENQSGAGLAADGDNNGVVNTLDYTVWANHYSGPAATAVPEPTGLAILIGSLVAYRFAPRRRIKGPWAVIKQ